jgi:DNA-directed RNA polymerase specialized sigma24 family protein
MQDVVRLKLHENHSERQTAKALGVAPVRVHRCLHEAYGHLQQLLEAYE